MTIDIYSPKTVKIPGGRAIGNYKRTLTVAAAEPRGGHYVLAFDTSTECGRFVEFIRFVQQTGKVDGFYTVHLVDNDEWISGRMIEQAGDCTMVIYHFLPCKRRRGKNFRQV